MCEGEILRYVFNGATLDWWDWGDKKQHEGTLVKVPCFISPRVVHPSDNGGREELVVPASNVVEFAFGGKNAG